MLLIGAELAIPENKFYFLSICYILIIIYTIFFNLYPFELIRLSIPRTQEKITYFQEEIDLNIDLRKKALRTEKR